jgi:hypothetical protein
MKIIPEDRYCKYDRKIIPSTRNKGAIHFTFKCGYDYPKDQKAEYKKKQKELEPGLYKSYEVSKRSCQKIKIIARGNNIKVVFWI